MKKESQNRKCKDFIASHRKRLRSRPRAKIAWSEEKKSLQKHLIEAAHLLAKLGLPFVADETEWPET